MRKTCDPIIHLTLICRSYGTKTYRCCCLDSLRRGAFYKTNVRNTWRTTEASAINTISFQRGHALLLTGKANVKWGRLKTEGSTTTASPIKSDSRRRCRTMQNSQTQYVDVGGYKLRRQVAGVGSPVVVLDSGFGDGWRFGTKSFPKSHDSLA